MSWRREPIGLENSVDHPGRFDYIMAVDETGTPSFNDKNDEWFTITGIVLSMSDFEYISKEVMGIKNKYWDNGMYNNKRVIFHSREIRKKIGPFSPKIINRYDFLEDLKELITILPFRIYSTCINKKKMIIQYNDPWDPYEISSEFISERYCMELNRERKNGILLLESRNDTLDKRLHDKFRNLMINGNRYHDKNFFSSMNGIYYNKKRTQEESKSYWQLEISDLCSYSIFNYAKTNEKDSLFKVIENKLSHYPNYDGKGLKIFP